VRAFQHFLRFVKYYFRAKTRYNVHSPFLFDFTETVLEDDRWYYAFSEIETLRRMLLTNRTPLQITDLGAGPQASPAKVRTVAILAKYSANQPFACRMLFRIVQRYKPRTMLELGTSLGISTGYQAAAALSARMITIEGCPNIGRQALENLERMKAGNVAMLQGRFEEMLPVALKELDRLDYVFIDGNHRKEPTLKYYGECLAHAHDGSVFVFDDIHWSAGMEQAWEAIKSHPKVRVTVDLFFFGVVFFRSENAEKEHFTLIKWAWKPWAIGFFDLFG